LTRQTHLKYCFLTITAYSWCIHRVGAYSWYALLLMITAIKPPICSSSGADDLATSGLRWMGLVLCWENFNDSKVVVHLYGIEDGGVVTGQCYLMLWEKLSQYMCLIWFDNLIDFCKMVSLWYSDISLRENFTLIQGIQLHFLMFPPCDCIGGFAICNTNLFRREDFVSNGRNIINWAITTLDIGGVCNWCFVVSGHKISQDQKWSLCTNCS
jgi:hypothetical protein